MLKDVDRSDGENCSSNDSNVFKLGMWSRLNQFEPQKFETTRHMWYWCDEWVDGNEARNCLDWTILNAPVSLNHLHFAVGLQCM